MEASGVFCKSFMKDKETFRKIVLLELMFEAKNGGKDFSIIEVLFYKVDFGHDTSKRVFKSTLKSVI